MKPEVLLYTTSWCPFCQRAKMLLKKKGVEWSELDIEADPAHRQAMIEASGRNTVPLVFMNGTHAGRPVDLSELAANGELETLLEHSPPANSDLATLSRQ